MYLFDTAQRTGTPLPIDSKLLVCHWPCAHPQPPVHSVLRLPSTRSCCSIRNHWSKSQALVHPQPLSHI